ncbi:MAG: deoxyribodipyrimidine photo-lyase [Pseudomonadales bacterium]|nr:deoxyribodipyrimidine photo-lyase [Pseudomonadales bacterium]
MNVLFVFRRDLRLEDNTALNEALRSGHKVSAVFFVDPALLNRWQNAEKRLGFLARSLKELSELVASKGGSLSFLTGNPSESLGELLSQEGFQAVYLNRDYTPFARRRDEKLEAVCGEKGVEFHAYDDHLLNPPGLVLKDDSTPYTVFTPYFRRTQRFQLVEPQPLVKGAFASKQYGRLEESPLGKFLETEPVSFVPGVSGATKALERFSGLASYDADRNVPAMAMTSRMSAHLRFGTCSPRQMAAVISEQLGAEHPLIRQLHWRDFYTQIAWFFPHVFGHAFRLQYDAIHWQQDADDFRRWCEGKTGFPIVDAGMRELAATGYMHNRVRMVVASFLTKNLHISWQQGETFFAEHLVDYEPAVNNGNWQWGASTGCDAQPYFRVFNPWRQQQKFDKDCVYIKRWVPELERYPPAAIHKLEKEGDFYLPQIVDLRSSSELIKAAFKEAAV